jgi:hypothetical protein
MRFEQRCTLRSRGCVPATGTRQPAAIEPDSAREGYDPDGELERFLDALWRQRTLPAGGPRMRSELIWVAVAPRAKRHVLGYPFLSNSSAENHPECLALP